MQQDTYVSAGSLIYPSKFNMLMSAQNMMTSTEIRQGHCGGEHRKAVLCRVRNEVWIDWSPPPLHPSLS